MRKNNLTPFITQILYVFRPCITRIVYGVYRVHAFGPQNDFDRNDEHALNPIGFYTQCLRALSRFFSPIPISFKLRRHSHYHPIKVTVKAFLSPYLSPISQKLQTSYKLLWIVREKLFRLTRRNMASLHAHRCDTIAFLVLILIVRKSHSFCT